MAEMMAFGVSQIRDSKRRSLMPILGKETGIPKNKGISRCNSINSFNTCATNDVGQPAVLSDAERFEAGNGWQD